MLKLIDILIISFTVALIITGPMYFSSLPETDASPGLHGADETTVSIVAWLYIIFILSGLSYLLIRFGFVGNGARE